MGHVEDRVDRIQMRVAQFLQLTLAVSAATAMFYGRWSIAFVSLAVFIMTYVPDLIERQTKIELPIEFELIIIVFLFASLFLGEVGGYYARFWWWDVALHTSSGIAFGFIGFLILYILSVNQKIAAKPFWIAVFAFSFSVALGTVWEIFEFSMDQLLGMNLQNSGLVDTMWDLVVNSIGALAVAIAGYFFLNGAKGYGFFRRVTTKFLRDNPQFLK